MTVPLRWVSRRDALAQLTALPRTSPVDTMHSIYHSIIGGCARQVIELEHLAGARMLADILTKAPARQIFRDLLALLDAFATNGNACLGP